MLPHLDSGYAVDQAILSEEDRVVIIRFGHDWDPVRRPARVGAGGAPRTRGAPPPAVPCLPPRAGSRRATPAPRGLGAHGSISVRAGSARRPSTRRPAPRGPLMPAAVCAQACMKMDETLYHVADKIKNFAVMYVARPIFDSFCRARARARTARLHAEPSPCSPAPRRVGAHEERRTSL